MSIEILMPALSPTMTEGNLVKWLKKEGDVVKAGNVLCEIETDKATMEVEAVDEGVLGKILIPEGSENVLVNSVIAVLLEEGEKEISINNAIPSKPITQAIEPIIEESVKLADHTKEQKKSVFVTPLAKRLAQDAGIDLVSIQGSGPRGRIIKADIQNQNTDSLPKTSQPREASLYEDVKVSLMRKTVAKRLSESKNTVPHFYLSIDCEMDALLALRATLKDTLKASVNDFLIKICAKALIDVPQVNVTWHDTFMRYHKSADISVAVAIDGGLVTPIVFKAETLTLSEISTTIKALAEKARAGKLQPQEYEGGTFTLSNLGMYGIANFNAIINPPQGCILAVGASEKRVIVKNDEPSIATMMTVTLSVDHRSVDGALGSKFLKSFKNYVENPVLALV